MQYYNEMSLSFMAKSENESFARVAVAAFITQLDPTLSDVADVKTAVSEAVTNAIIHGYENQEGIVHIKCFINDNSLTVHVKDDGKGITDIAKAREPLYTSKPELERSGMGFTVMESFMDSVAVESHEGQGTEVIMTKKLT